MNYLIISDIHGSADALRTVLNTHYFYDAIILVGDLLYHGPRNPILNDYDPASVLKILNDLKVPILAVRGNCDSEVDQMVLDFSMMQDYSVLDYEGTKIFITHGHIIDPKDALIKRHGDIFISGHTHVHGIHYNQDGVVCINPGSISMPKERQEPTYALLSDHTISIYSLKHELKVSYKVKEPR